MFLLSLLQFYVQLQDPTVIMLKAVSKYNFTQDSTSKTDISYQEGILGGLFKVLK